MASGSTRSQGAPAVASQALLVDVAAVTHPGKVRENNEDAYVVCRIGRYLERISSNLPETVIEPRFDESGLILIVADGMGGMAAGEVASHTAIGTLIQLALGAPRWVLRLDDPATREDEIEEIWSRAREYLGKVHAVVKRLASADPALAGMGTTLTAAYSLGGDLFVTHVGDSRAYLLHEGSLLRITRDHTLAQTYAEMGVIPPAEVESHRLRHILTQAVGGPEDEPRADLHAARVEPGDRVLLCSDGLSGSVGEDELARALAEAATSREACDRLLELALDQGGRDNITVIVAGYRARDAAA